jgi:hypothetical protein
MGLQLTEAAEKSWRPSTATVVAEAILDVVQRGIEPVRPQPQAAAASPLPSPNFGDSSGLKVGPKSRRA